MKADNIKQILVSDLLGYTVFHPSGCCKSVTAETKALIRRLNSQVGNCTEMETTARVLILMLEVVNRIPSVKIKMQPSEQGHSTFTNFYLHVQTDDRVPLLIIEVKNAATAAKISDTDATAQILREVHILLTEVRQVTDIAFILTNSKTWGIGEATREGSKIRVTSNFTHAIPSPITFQEKACAVAGLLDHIEEVITKGLSIAFIPTD